MAVQYGLLLTQEAFSANSARHRFNSFSDRVVKAGWVDELGQEPIRHAQEPAQLQRFDAAASLRATIRTVDTCAGAQQDETFHPLRCLTQYFERDITAHRQSYEREPRRGGSERPLRHGSRLAVARKIRYRAFGDIGQCFCLVAPEIVIAEQSRQEKDWLAAMASDHSRSSLP